MELRKEIITAIDETENLLVKIHTKDIDVKELLKINRRNHKLLIQFLKYIDNNKKG